MRVCSNIYDILTLNANNFWLIVDFHTEIASKILFLNNISHLRKGSFTVVQNQDGEKKSNFISFDFILLFVCYLGMLVDLHKNARSILQ